MSTTQKEVKNNKFHCPRNYTVKNCNFGEKKIIFLKHSLLSNFCYLLIQSTSSCSGVALQKKRKINRDIYF